MNRQEPVSCTPAWPGSTLHGDGKEMNNPDVTSGPTSLPRIGHPSVSTCTGYRGQGGGQAGPRQGREPLGAGPPLEWAEGGTMPMHAHPRGTHHPSSLEKWQLRRNYKVCGWGRGRGMGETEIQRRKVTEMGEKAKPGGSRNRQKHPGSSPLPVPWPSSCYQKTLPSLCPREELMELVTEGGK